MPVNATREAFWSIVAARGLPRSRVRVSIRRRLLNNSGLLQCCRTEAVERWLERRGHTERGRFADVRYTEYVDGGHDAWSRALQDGRLFKWAFKLKG